MENYIKLSLSDIISIVFLSFFLFDRYIIFHIGFQFSFIVTFAIILSAKWLQSANSTIEKMFRISFIEQMIIVPLEMYYFYYFEYLIFLLNIIVILYFTLFLIPSMFFGLCLLVLPEVISNLFCQLFMIIHKNVLFMLSIIDTYSNFPFITGDISLTFAMIYYGLLFLLMGL